MNYGEIVQDVIDGYKETPIDMLGIGDSEGEYIYLNALKDSYVRTLRDVDVLNKCNRGNKKLLEIGSFLGPVSIALKKIGYSLDATDIPEFYESKALRELYKKNDIPFVGLNLKSHQLPYESNSFDTVIICEVIEHLNFNPLPILQEVNRVIKRDGFIYIGMPNQSHILNRIKLLLGKSIHNPIEDYFKQLDKNENMIVGLHWREYTLAETEEVIKKMGFEVVQKYHYFDKDQGGTFRKLIKRLLYLIPSFRPFHVVVGKKKSDSTIDFWLTDANS